MEVYINLLIMFELGYFSVKNILQQQLSKEKPAFA